MTGVQRAVRWKLADQVISQGLVFLVAVALARLVLPAEFGLFAMLFLLLALAELFVSGGLAWALIQRRDITPADESTVFWFNLAVGAVLAVALAALAPAVAGFFEQPRLTALLRVLSVDLVLAALVTVPLARLTRALAFRRIATVSAVSIAGGGLVAIGLAALGAGAWALVGQVLAVSLLRLATLVVIDDWRPRAVLSPARFRVLFAFGGWLMLSSVLAVLARQAYTVIVGKVYTPTDLGVFNRAVNTRGLPQAFIGKTYVDVGFPVLARLADEPAALRATLRASLVAVMALTLPVMTGLALVAEDLVPVLFGPNWTAVTPYLQLLAVGGIGWILNLVNMNALRAVGEARASFRVQLVVQLTLLAAVAVSAPFSLLALAAAMAAVEFGAVGLSASLLGRRVGYGLGAQLRDLAPYLVLLAVMTAAVLAQRALAPAAGHLYGLLASAGTGAAVYLLPLFVLRLEAVAHLRALLRRGAEAAAESGLEPGIEAGLERGIEPAVEADMERRTFRG